MTDKTISIVNAHLTDSYNVLIKDASGKIVLSKMEVLSKKVAEGKIPVDELIRQLPINKSPRKVSIEPQQDLNLGFNLSDYYDLQTKGKYQIEISRKIIKPEGSSIAELSFGTIELEIK